MGGAREWTDGQTDRRLREGCKVSVWFHPNLINPTNLTTNVCLRSVTASHLHNQKQIISFYCQMPEHKVNGLVYFQSQASKKGYGVENVQML